MTAMTMSQFVGPRMEIVMQAPSISSQCSDSVVTMRWQNTIVRSCWWVKSIQTRRDSESKCDASCLYWERPAWVHHERYCHLDQNGKIVMVGMCGHTSTLILLMLRRLVQYTARSRCTLADEGHLGCRWRTIQMDRRRRANKRKGYSLPLFLCKAKSVLSLEAI